MQLKIKKLHPNAKVPTYAKPGDACFDLYALTVNDAHHLGSNVTEGYPVICDTGVAFEVPEGHVMLVFSRSGHGFNSNTRLGNGTGVIDSGFRSSVKVKLTCDQDEPDDKPPLFIKPGDRVAQALILPIPQISFVEVDALSETERGTGGFGSTGQ